MIPAKVLAGIGTTAMMDEHSTGGHPHARRAARWFSWVFGVAMLAAVVIAALHFSDEREFVHLAERAEPCWLAVAVLLQAGTYFAQGETWRVVTRAAAVPLPVSVAYELSLAKLFMDQALPSGGLSGIVVVARALEQRGVPRGVIMASVIVETVSYYAAYVLALGLALVIVIVDGHASPLIIATTVLFIVFCVALAAAALSLSHRQSAGPRWLARIPLLQHGLTLLRQADPRLARDPRLIWQSGVLQLAIVVLDAATMWMLILSLGQAASLTGVFASFMISTLLRTISVVPGGLGAFEAASVVTLRLAGVPVAVALSATLLFRGLSFWLPMIPGLIFSRSARRAT